MLRLGILGAGTIGYRVAQACAHGEVPYEIVSVLDNDPDKRGRVRALGAKVDSAGDLIDLLRASDVVVEAAAASAVAPLMEKAQYLWQLTDEAAEREETYIENEAPIGLLTRARTNELRGERKRVAIADHIVVMSVGGLLDVDLTAPGPTIHAPSGALGGLDAIQAMAIAGLDEVTLTTRKPPAGLGMDVTEETVLFEGSARDVIAKYPKNVNVAVALSLAGIGPDRTRCRLVADPAIERNTHHVVARGAAGEVEFVSRNVPSPDNPATSYLAALSAIALLKKLASKLQVG